MWWLSIRSTKKCLVELLPNFKVDSTKYWVTTGNHIILNLFCEWKTCMTVEGVKVMRGFLKISFTEGGIKWTIHNSSPFSYSCFLRFTKMKWLTFLSSSVFSVALFFVPRKGWIGTGHTFNICTPTVEALENLRWGLCGCLWSLETAGGANVLALSWRGRMKKFLKG